MRNAMMTNIAISTTNAAAVIERKSLVMRGQRPAGSFVADLRRAL